ncbi:MAG: hypothetical protein NDJ90_13410 [Oligoflexia bacterium]|nr:hypothetical protein [Oligoflexia bacterium]
MNKLILVLMIFGSASAAQAATSFKCTLLGNEPSQRTARITLSKSYLFGEFIGVVTNESADSRNDYALDGTPAEASDPRLPHRKYTMHAHAAGFPFGPSLLVDEALLDEEQSGFFAEVTRRLNGTYTVDTIFSCRRN